jgi:hypothetical protein
MATKESFRLRVGRADSIESFEGPAPADVLSLFGSFFMRVRCPEIAAKR